MNRKKANFKTQRKSVKVEDVSDPFSEDAPIHPNDQLQLSEEELKEEITRVLTAADPHGPDNIVRFDLKVSFIFHRTLEKENQYKQIPRVDQMAIHFQLDGNIVHVDSEEAKIQLGLLDPTFITEDKIDEVEEEHEGLQAPALVQRSAEPSVIKLVNQFNFCEHASQTYNNASKDDITCYDILLMQLPKEANDDPGSLQVSSHESGTALEFHRKDSQIFLIATEEGMIHKCSRTYGSEYLLTLKAHNMAVYRLNWNYFHDDIFITCSADWTVKIWHQYKEDPLFVFDLGAPVGDVAWAPYSSTVFAAVTSDGNVRIYDLNVNKYEPLCLQMVAQKKHTKLTHVAFNPIHPIIICGDDRGQVMSLKLSPNLRKKPKEKKGLEKPDPTKVEIEKMEKLLSFLN